MPWWGWVLVGTLLLAAELFVVEADFYLVFLGFAAVVVGLLDVAGLGGPIWLEWLLFAVIALGSTVLFRQRIYEKLRPPGGAGLATRWSARRRVVRDAIAPGGHGHAELRGAVWQAKNVGAAPLARRRARAGRAESTGSCSSCAARPRRNAMENLILVAVHRPRRCSRSSRSRAPRSSCRSSRRYVIENLGKYSRTLHAGFHILIPFVERVAYRHSLKEQAVDVHEQICITKDNVQVGVDGVLYLQVLDPQRASYGITDYGFAISQLAQTTLRSEMGKIELDRTFEERGTINASVVSELDKASAPWGVKVLRYEIKNINPPAGIVDAMEKQMRAEREKRAMILASEGERDARDQPGRGREAARHQGVRGEPPAADQRGAGRGRGDPRGRARDRRGPRRRSRAALQSPGGDGAMRLRIAEQYIQQFGHLAKAGQHLRRAGEPVGPRGHADARLDGAARRLGRGANGERGARPASGSAAQHDDGVAPPGPRRRGAASSCSDERSITPGLRRRRRDARACIGGGDQRAICPSGRGAWAQRVDARSPGLRRGARARPSSRSEELEVVVRPRWKPTATTSPLAVLAPVASLPRERRVERAARDGGQGRGLLVDREGVDAGGTSFASFAGRRSRRRRRRRASRRVRRHVERSDRRRIEG